MFNSHRFHSLLQWVAPLALAGLFVGCAPVDDSSEEVTDTSEALGSTIRIAGHVGAGRVGVAGVTVTLNGQSQATTLTDSNGNYKFDVATGSYSVSVAKAGATLSPSVLNLNALTASTFSNVSCTAGCTAPATIVPERELVITDPGVVNDARSDSATGGRWSFRFLMGQMAPAGQSDSWMTLGWMDQLSHGGTVGGFAVDPRNTNALGFTVDQGGNLSWGTSPFKLVAIVNRTDLHGTGQGELRFVFGAGGSMTVIFEYGLPATRTRKGWATQFHALASMTPGTAAYNAALQAITDQVVVANTSPSKPNGSSINQVRVNEIFLSTAASPNWQLREFHLQSNGTLLLSPTAATPDDIANTVGSAQNTALASFINGNVVDLLGGFASVPTSLIGGQSNEANTNVWTQFGTTTVNEGARHAFAGATCSGCHFAEVNRNLPAGVTNPQNTGVFYQISPSGTLSPLMTSVEIPRRAIFAQHLLACTTATCAAGAEPMLP